MAIDYSNSSLKRKIAVSYIFIFLVSAFAMLFLYKGIQNLQLVDKTNASPNIKLERMNGILTLIYEAESQARSYFIFRDTAIFNKYIKSLNAIENNIDTLSAICKENPEQVNHLNTIRSLLKQKKDIIFKLIKVSGTDQQDMLYSRALEEIYIQAYELYGPSKIIKEQITIKRDSIYNAPQKKGFLQKIKNVFSENNDELSKVITQQSTSSDTIVQYGTTPDTIVKTMQQALDKMKIREHYLRNLTLSQETKLLHSDRILLSKIREIATLLEAEELARVTSVLRQSSLVLRKASRAIMFLALVSIGVIIFFLYLIFRDIARSRRHQLALQVAKQHAEDLIKMKEQFLANMSHEIRTPLSSIIGFTEQLHKTFLEPRQQLYLQTIQKSSDHLLGLVNDILDISKIDAGKFTLEKIRFNLVDLLQEISHVFSLKARDKNIELTCNVDTELNRDFIGDPFRIRQVLINIVGNALKFTEQGSVTIEASVMSERNNKIRVKIAVTDTGIGIDPEQQKAIFDEFSQADSGITRRYGGTGLGLSIAKKIVDLNGGKISLKSAPGKGSTFTVEIPLEIPSSVHEIAGELPTDASLLEEIDDAILTRLKETKVLVVDDDETTLMLVSSLFQNMGIDGKTLANAAEVMEILKQKQFDIIFTDIQMPGMSGIELLHAIRSHPESNIAQLPVVALTANFNIKEHQLNSGFTNFLLKPFKESDFYNKLIEVLFPGNHLLWSAKQEQNQSIEEEGVPYSLEEISNFTINDPVALKKIVQTFVDKSLKTIQEIKELASQSDINKISFCAHKLLPTFRQFKIYAVVGDLEKLERHKEINLQPADFIAITQKIIETAEKIIKRIQKENA